MRIIRLLAGLISMLVCWAPSVALAATASSFECKVVDANGLARAIQFAIDSVPSSGLIGFGFVGDVEGMPTPQKVAFYAGIDRSSYLVDTDKGQFLLYFDLNPGRVAEISFTPHTNAAPELGFLGYCRGSAAAPPPYLPVAVMSSDPGNSPFRGWTKVSVDIRKDCKFVQANFSYSTGKLEVLSRSDDGISFPMTLEVGGVRTAGMVSNFAVSNEGDHALIGALFSIGDKQRGLVGAMKTRGSVQWVYFGPAKGSTLQIEALGVCFNHPAEGQIVQ